MGTHPALRGNEARMLAVIGVVAWSSMSRWWEWKVNVRYRRRAALGMFRRSEPRSPSAAFADVSCDAKQLHPPTQLMY